MLSGGYFSLKTQKNFRAVGAKYSYFVYGEETMRKRDRKMLRAIDVKGSENRMAGHTENAIPPALFRRDLIKTGLDGKFSACPPPPTARPSGRPCEFPSDSNLFWFVN